MSFGINLLLRHRHVRLRYLNEYHTSTNALWIIPISCFLSWTSLPKPVLSCEHTTMITVWFKEQPFTTLIISDTINNEGYRTHNRKISDTYTNQKHCKIQHYPIQSILAVMFIHGVRRAMVQKFGFSISTLHNISQPHIRRQSFLSITHCAGRYYVAFFYTHIQFQNLILHLRFSP